MTRRCGENTSAQRAADRAHKLNMQITEPTLSTQTQHLRTGEEAIYHLLLPFSRRFEEDNPSIPRLSLTPPATFNTHHRRRKQLFFFTNDFTS